jgi:Spy/CpxP family protein refolding chaperone
MEAQRHGMRLALMLAIAASATAAHAEDYRCETNTSIYWSPRPCPTRGQLGGMGPEPTRREVVTTTYIAPIGQAPDHQAYMSATCASMNDAIRTGPARGLQSAAMLELQRAYRKKCDEDEQQARQRFDQQKQAQRNERQSQQAAEQADQARVATSREQCDELLRILHGKRKQFDAMSAGQKADFQRFEGSYNERCKR